MRHQDLIARLEAFAPQDEREGRDRDAIVAFLRRGGEAFSRRRFDPGHLTGSAFVVDEGLDHVLLLHHARLDKWLQPGGHGEPGEHDPLAVALREALEETGITGLKPHPSATQPFDIDIHDIPPRLGPDPAKHEPAHKHLDLRYLIVAPRGARPKKSEESKAIMWLPLGEAAGDTSEPGMVRAFAKIRALKGRA